MQAIPTGKTPPIVYKVIKKYKLEAAHVLSPQKGYRNISYPIILTDGHKLNLIFYKNEPGIVDKIKNAHDVAKLLSEKKFPVRHAQNEHIVRMLSPVTERYCALYNYLSGETIPWEAYTKDHLKLVGKAMSDMHDALLSTPISVTFNLPRVADEYEIILRRMRGYFSDEKIVLAIQEKLSVSPDVSRIEVMLGIVNSSKRLNHQQVLHMDFVRGNLLFENDQAGTIEHGTFRVGGTELTGIIDFEKVSYGHKVFDIARTLAFLLVDCKYKPEEKIRKYFLDSGYNKRGAGNYHKAYLSVNGVKVDLLEELIDMYLLYDFYKFLRHNPYEYLEQNEHYTRTRDNLLERRIIFGCR